MNDVEKQIYAVYWSEMWNEVEWIEVNVCEMSWNDWNDVWSVSVHKWSDDHKNYSHT